jgi:anti-anti-sigma factor
MSAQAPRPETDAGPLLGSASVLVFGSLTTVIASGEFDAGTLHGLAEALELACTKGTNVVLDMTGVSFLDGAALRLVENAAATLVAAGRSLRITHAPTVVVRLIHVAKAAQLLQR